MVQRPDAGGYLTENDDVRKKPTFKKPETPTYNRSSELRSFMWSLFTNNGNSFGGNSGGYGFPKGQWASMAAAAGLKGASMNDAAAQTYVAAFWMDNLYKRYHNWNLVAIAWKSGGAAVTTILKQLRKEPADVTAADIRQIDSEAADTASAVTDRLVKAEQKGGVPEGPQPEGEMVRTGGGGVRTVIEGHGNVAQRDAYSATLDELRKERQELEAQRRPSGAEMLFSQLESLSNVISGGTGRVDWRHDAQEVESGGEVEPLGAMDVPGSEQSGN